MAIDFYNKNLILKCNCENENLKFILNFMKEKSELVSFFSGGTTAESRSIHRKVINVIKECKDFYEDVKLQKGLEFISTTTLNHRYGFTVHYMLPALFGYCINTERVNYPEDLNVKNALLVTTPSFLDMMCKYDYKPEVCPEVIISAGAKLEDKTFKYARSISKRVIDMYGSSETGIIGWRENENDAHKLLRGVQILECEDDYTKIATEYSENEFEVLGDRIEQTGEYIRFLARNGRILKIQEKRIDSLCMEDEIKKHHFVKDCICFENNGKIAALAALNEDGMDFILKKGKLTFIKELKSLLLKQFEVIPQRWKFIDEIPKTLNGKIDKMAIDDIFNTNLSFPLIISREFAKDRALFSLCFLSGSNFFKGHFDSMPILPGVVELYYADYFIQAAFGLNCKKGQQRRIKFANIINPDEIVNLELVKTASGVEFKYFKEDKMYSSGILPLKNWFEEADL